MSKTIVGILEIGAGIGLQFVPGGQAIGQRLILAGAVTELGELLKPQAPRSSQSETAIKNGVPVRVSGYGCTRHCQAHWI